MQLAILDVIVKMIVPVLVQARSERLGSHIRSHVIGNQSCSLVTVLIDHRAQSLVSTIWDIAHNCGLGRSVKNSYDSIYFPRKQTLRLELLRT